MLLPTWVLGITILFFILVVVAYLGQRTSIVIPVLPATFLLLIYTVYTYHALTSLNPRTMSRVFIYILSSATGIFLIPRIISKKHFLRSAAVVTSIIVIIALPSIIIGNYNALFFDVTVRSSALGIGGVDLYRPNSILTGPNPFGFIALTGIFASYSLNNSTIKAILVSVSGFALLTSWSRSAILAAIVATGLLAITRWFNPSHAKKIIVSGAVVGSIGYLQLMNLLPGPAFLDQIYLSRRGLIMNAEIEVFLQSPLIGHGPQRMDEFIPANSSLSNAGAGVYIQFLRLFITTGVVGGISYLLLFVLTIIKLPIKSDSKHSIYIYPLFVAFIINELFAANSIFGLSFTSLIGCLSLGYILSDIYEYEL